MSSSFLKLTQNYRLSCITLVGLGIFSWSVFSFFPFTKQDRSGSDLYNMYLFVGTPLLVFILSRIYFQMSTVLIDIGLKSANVPEYVMSPFGMLLKTSTHLFGIMIAMNIPGVYEGYKAVYDTFIGDFPAFVMKTYWGDWVNTYNFGERVFYALAIYALIFVAIEFIFTSLYQLITKKKPKAKPE